MGATGGYALDEALGEGGDACVVVLVCVRVSYTSEKYQVVERWEGRSQYPCTQAHCRVEMRHPIKGCHKHPTLGLEE